METALLVACGLLLIGFVLRATTRVLQVFYVPAAVVGGIIGLIAAAVASPQLFSTDLSLRDGLNGKTPADGVRRVFERNGIALEADAKVRVEKHDSQWRVSDANGSYLVIRHKKRLEVHRLRLGWNTPGIAAELRTWPGWLIAVVFAGLLIERPGKSLARSLTLAARAGIVVWIIILGEIALGLLGTWLCIAHFGLELPASFGQLIEVGFAGGHGTAAAMGEVFEKELGFDAGMDLGFFFATVGLTFGVVSGIVYVNIAVRRGWTAAGDAKVPMVSGLEARGGTEAVAFGRVRSEVIDPLVFQVAIFAVAFTAGVALKSLIMLLIPPVAGLFGADEHAAEEAVRFASRMPLFMFTLIGGLLVREAMHALRIGDLIDAQSVRRITGGAMEFLIVAAIASMKLSVLIDYGWPVALLLSLGFAWTAFCLFVIARRLLPGAYWFELGILNYGMSTGTTAQGMMLLRIIDKDLKSGAAEDYALAAPLSAPFIGGGVITLIALPLLLQKISIGWVVLGLAVVMCGLGLLGSMMVARDHGRSGADT